MLVSHSSKSVHCGYISLLLHCGNCDHAMDAIIPKLMTAVAIINIIFVSYIYIDLESDLKLPIL